MSGARCPALSQTMPSKPMLDRIKRLFYRPEFFREGNFTADQGMTFYSLAVLALTIGLSVVAITGLFGLSRYFDSSDWERRESGLRGMYHGDLVLTLDNGRLTSNHHGPVGFQIPYDWKQRPHCRKSYVDCRIDDLPRHFAVIEPGLAISPQAFIDRDTLILANETEIGFRHPDRGETRVFALSELQIDKRIVITDDLYQHWVGLVGPTIQKGIYLIMYALPIVMYIGLWIGYLAYALLGAVIVMLAAHVQGHTLRYGRAYLSALYLLPVPFVFSFLMSLGHYHIPFLAPILLFVMALVNFPKAPKLPDPVKIASTDTSVVPKDAEVEPASASDGEKPKEGGGACLGCEGRREVSKQTGPFGPVCAIIVDYEEIS